jgi:hypothetical protein
VASSGISSPAVSVTSSANETLAERIKLKITKSAGFMALLIHKSISQVTSQIGKDLAKLEASRSRKNKKAGDFPAFCMCFERI